MKEANWPRRLVRLKSRWRIIGNIVKNQLESIYIHSALLADSSWLSFGFVIAGKRS